MPGNLGKLPLNELRQMWARAWGREPHARIGRTMLEKSLEYKIREREGRDLTPEQQARLEQLLKQYKRNPACFDGNGPFKARHAISAHARGQEAQRTSEGRGVRIPGPGL